jgi:membrane protein
VAASLDRVAMPSQLEAVALSVVPVSMSALAFFLVYRIIPNRHVPALHALAGGVLAAVVFEAMKSLFAAYISVVPTYQLVYGAFAAIPIFLLWLYIAWLVVLFGAEVTASLSDWRREDPQGMSEEEMRELLRDLESAGVVRSLDGKWIVAAPGKDAPS